MKIKKDNLVSLTDISIKHGKLWFELRISPIFAYIKNLRMSIIHVGHKENLRNGFPYFVFKTIIKFQ